MLSKVIGQNKAQNSNLLEKGICQSQRRASQSDRSSPWKSQYWRLGYEVWDENAGPVPDGAVPTDDIYAPPEEDA